MKSLTRSKSNCIVSCPRSLDFVTLGKEDLLDDEPMGGFVIND